MTLPALRDTQSPNYSSRGGSVVRLIVVHDCEGSFNGSVSWFSQARSRVSAHIVLSEDGAQAVQMVAWANKAWHVRAYNSFSEGIEASGYMEKGFGAPEWDALASIVAFRLHARGLLPVWAKNGAGVGFCQHADLGVAGGGHHDLTSSTLVWQNFVDKVVRAYGEPQPASWTTGGVADVHAAVPGWVPRVASQHDFSVDSLEWVQMELNAHRVTCAPLIVDGIEGPATRNAIKVFQGSAGLLVDGEAGPQTIAALQKSC